MFFFFFLQAFESKRSMFDIIGDEISTFVEDSDQVEEICESVRQALLREIDESKKAEVEADENTVVSNSSQQFSVSMSRVRAVFGKEAKKRRDVMVIGDDALHCRHEFFGEPCGGLKCQVCDFETKNRVWKCGKQCSIGLCGSCAFKWKKNILHL